LKSYKVGILGFGNVSRAIVSHYLFVADKILKDYGFKLEFSAICDSNSFVYANNLNIIRLIRKKEKKQNISGATVNPLKSFGDIVKNKKIDMLIDGLPSSKINEGPSFPLLIEALKRNISVVCVNKSPLVFKGAELFKLAQKYNTRIGISGTTAGALPTSGIVMNELVGGEITEVRGIVNGTSNYVLDSIMFDGLSMDTAIRNAIKRGIAEPDYRFDLDGTDTCFKMIILGLIITGKSIKPKDVLCQGILPLSLREIKAVVKQNKVFRLIGNLSIKNNTPKISVAPEILDEKDPLYFVRGTGKGITFKTKYLGELTVYLNAASRTTIAATILKDIINIAK